MLLAFALVACSSPRESALSTGRTPVPTRGPERYVAIGASDTVGVGAREPAKGSWPARVAAQLVSGSTYKNLGVSGSLAAQARTQQSPAAIDAQPTLITMWLAVNDLNGGVTSTAYRDVIDGILGELVARTEAQIFLGNVPDLRSVPAYSGVDQAALGAQVAAYNRWIGETAAKYPSRVVVVDLFTGSADLVSSATVSPDGFHPSDRGYELIAERYVAAMRQAGIRLRP